MSCRKCLVVLTLALVVIATVPAGASEPRGSFSSIDAVWQLILKLIPSFGTPEAPYKDGEDPDPNGGERGAGIDPNGLLGTTGVPLNGSEGESLPPGGGDRGPGIDPNGSQRGPGIDPDGGS
jgi:hypothetical protein